jgi:hypothetical protein
MKTNPGRGRRQLVLAWAATPRMFAPPRINHKENRDCVWGVGLQFDGIGAPCLGSMQDAHRLLKILMMIGGKLGHHIHRLTRADQPFADFEIGIQEARGLAWICSMTCRAEKGVRRPLRRISSERSPSLKTKSSIEA